MPKRLSRNAKCPCQSGKKYKDCCWKKSFEWNVDSDGEIVKTVPIHPELLEYLEQELQWHEQTFGRKPGPNEFFSFDRPRADSINEKVANFLLEAGTSPELAYATYKTGLMVTAFNKNLLTDSDLKEWNDAIEEYRRLQAKAPPPTETDLKYIRTLERLEHEAKNCRRILTRIIHEHGIARNIRGDEENAVFQDFLFFCYTKSLKTFEGIQSLLSAGYGEDCLTLSRTILEIYITVAYLLRTPEKIIDLVIIPIRVETGLCERATVDGRKVFRDKETGNIYPRKISVWQRANETYDQSDPQIYQFLYDYLSDYVHPNISAITNYLDGHYFETDGREKIFHGALYSVFSMVLLLETIVPGTFLEHQFRCDLVFYLKKTAVFLEEVFSGMTHESNKDTPETFIVRLSALRSRCDEWLTIAKKRGPDTSKSKASNQ